VPRLTLHDPLAELLGAADNGLIEYSYTDAVKLAGIPVPPWRRLPHDLKALAKLYRIALRTRCHPGRAARGPGGRRCRRHRRRGRPAHRRGGEGGFKDWEGATAAVICCLRRPLDAEIALPGLTRVRDYRPPTILK